MSYDYNALVQQIATSRRQATEIRSRATTNNDDAAELTQHLQSSLDAFSTLSEHCPMTPLLWMQYAADTCALLKIVTPDDASSAQETRLQLLELGLEEFPGSAILQLHYLQLLIEFEVSNEGGEGSSSVRVTEALSKALHHVGRGSHRNEASLVVQLYRLDAEYKASHDTWDEAMKSFRTRARVPLKDANDTLSAELQEFCSKYDKSVSQEDLKALDEGRRHESKVFAPFATWEDELDVAMHNEGILARHRVNLEEIDWEEILKSDEKTCWMGLGGMASADAFIKYAQACSYFRKRSDQAEDEQSDKEIIETEVKSLAIAVYERGIAECPTVEKLWISYIRHLKYLILDHKDLIAPLLQSAITRAIRNCPYSLPLFQQRMDGYLVLANAGKIVMDPDSLMKIVQTALDAKFLTTPAACLQLYLSAIQVMRRRILVILSDNFASTSNGGTDTKPLGYDDSEPVLPKPAPSSEMDESVETEIQDFCEDIREMYDTADEYIRKHHKSWSEGRSVVWMDRAQTEVHLIGPLLRSFGDDPPGDNSDEAAEIIRIHEKISKIHQPTHPDTFSTYIQDFFHLFPNNSAGRIISKIRQTRALYQKAIKMVGRSKKPSQLLDQSLFRDFETALQHICHEYLQFERHFGSEHSLSQATKAIEKKLSKLVGPNHGRNGNGLPAASRSSVGMETEAVPVDEEPVWKPEEVVVDTSAPGEREEDSKRKSEGAGEERPAKKQKIDTEAMDIDTAQKGGDDHQGEVAPTPKAIVQHKVKVGKMEYPAHPYTVRVMNLSDETEDMDLVDAFRPKCGAVVHARILREKQYGHGRHGRSKGWALVQFEEKESVEKALALSEVIGIKEKVVKVDRSHQPAALIVPPGMHRVAPKGEGKVSKRNEKRKHQNDDESMSKKDVKGNDGEPHETRKPPKVKANVLTFRPRGVAHGNAHRKVKLSLTAADKEGK